MKPATIEHLEQASELENHITRQIHDIKVALNGISVIHGEVRAHTEQAIKSEATESEAWQKVEWQIGSLKYTNIAFYGVRIILEAQYKGYRLELGNDNGDVYPWKWYIFKRGDWRLSGKHKTLAEAMRLVVYEADCMVEEDETDHSKVAWEANDPIFLTHTATYRDWDIEIVCPEQGRWVVRWQRQKPPYRETSCGTNDLEKAKAQALEAIDREANK
jgi:hypothetical protein